jgi:hypothetical protein
MGVDDFSKMGQVPQAFIAAKTDPEKLKTLSAEETTKASEYTARMQQIVLCNCVVIVNEDGKPTGEKIVDKDPEEVKENEISWKEFAPGDAVQLVNAATEMSGYSQEAAQAAKPFPTES